MIFHQKRVKDLFSLLSGYKLITVIGAGGKTTLIECASKEIKDKGFSVVMTTTTKILAKEPYLLESQLTEELLSLRPLLRIGGELKDGKLHSVSEETLAKLKRFYDVIFVEGDGAKGRPLKYCAEHEPVIPPSSDFVIVICGLDGLGKKVKDVVFRWELLKEMERFSDESVIDEERFVSIVCKGMVRRISGKRYAICLNKYDTIREKTKIYSISRMLGARTDPDFIFVSSLKYGIFYKLEKEYL
ncbi:MAG: selenium cofactor biosynthesis protein YqeC [Desulfobacterota bacterium]|nr:selenium cofactor biosynthesis protein YqeC [Thermodesulfobacteriota bacterium]MDW8001386.1 selenium cofactor biosynthesis protein YqeC [Deltaproteobacteria bacterium]